MRKFIGVILCIMMCIGLTSCAVYSSANMARLKSDNLTVMGPWGYVHGGANTTATFYTGRQAASKDAVKENGVIDWPALSNIQEDANSNLNIGKPAKGFPTEKIIVPEETQSSIIEAITNVIGKK